MKSPRRPQRIDNSKAIGTQDLSKQVPLLDQALLPYLLLDSSGTILEANPSAARLLGKERRLLRCLPLREFVCQGDREKLERHLDQCRSRGKRISTELRLGTVKAPVVDLISSSFIASRSQKALLQMIIYEHSMDGSGSLAATAGAGEIQKLNRTLKALSESSQVMMRAVDEAGYMSDVCRIVQRDCGHAMVWIGFARDDKGRSILPVAHAGFEDGYLETLRLTWAETERGRGPTGTAVRTGQPVICRNMHTDPRFKPWREEAIKRGYAASIALPLTTEGKTFGAITIYSREPDPFSDDEVKLLSELAGDLSYGLTALRLRAAHEAAERSLRESEARYRALFDSMTEGFALHEIITDSHGWPCDYRFLDVNPSFERLTGLTHDQLIGKRVLEVLPGNEPIWIERYGRVALTGEPARFESYSAPLGRWYEVFAYRPAPMQFAVTFADITVRKQAEKELERSTERFALLSETAGALLLSANPQAVVDELCRKVMAHLDCDIFLNFLMEEETQRLRLNACGGIAAEDLEKVQWLDAGAAICGFVAQERHRAIVEDIQHIPDSRTELVKSFGVQAYCCHPLMAGERVAGTLSFGSKRRPRFSEDDVELMRVVADQVSVALERLRTAKVLRESEERLQDALRVSCSFAFDWIPATDRVHRSQSCAPLLGLTGKEAEDDTSQQFFQRIDPRDREKFIETLHGLTPHADQYEIKYRYLRPDGGVTVLEESGRGFFDPDGRLSRLIGVTTDVTARERAEEALRELNARLEQRVQDRTAALQRTTQALEAERRRFMDVLDVLPAYVILLTPDYHVSFANRYFEERFGKALGRRCYEYLFNRTEPCEVCETMKPFRTNAPVKWEWTGPDGRTYDISDFPFTDTDGSKLVLEMGIDITDRKLAEAELERHRHHLEELVNERTSQLSAANMRLQSEIAERKEAEEALQESEERFRLAIQHSKLMAWECDKDMRFTWIYNSHFGVPGDELLGKTPAELGKEKVMQEFTEHCSEVLACGTGFRKTVKHVHTGNREQYFDQQVEVVRNAAGNIMGLIGISLDVTERVLAEHRLHKSEESFRLMVAHSVEPMLLVDESGKIECISRKAANQLGFQEAELMGGYIERFLDWSGKLDLTMRLNDFLRHAPLPARGVLRVKAYGGTWCWIDVEASFVNYGQKPEKYLLKFEVIDTKNGSQ